MLVKVVNNMYNSLIKEHCNMNNLKRMFSCLSVLAVCLLANMGIEAKAITSSPVTAIMQNKVSENAQNQVQQFTLHNGITQAEANTKLADHYSHYSHSSHVSHHSHYSSRY